MITLYGDTPSKKNSRNLFVRNGKLMNLPSKRYYDWVKANKNSVLGHKAPETPCAVSITLYPQTKRKADLTNRAESCMDFLVESGMIEDDNFFVIPSVVLNFGAFDKENPRAEITFKKLV